jgi:hypothetical protein
VIEPDTGSNSGSILIQVAGGIAPYSYLWSNGDTTNHPMNLGVGNYGLTVTDVLGCTAEYNFFLISSTDDLLPGFSELTVFPNPLRGDGELHLQIIRKESETRSLLLHIRDAHGRIIQTERFVLRSDKELLRCRIEGMPAGMLFLQLEDEESGASILRRILIQ